MAQVNGNDYVMTTRTAPDGGIQPGKTLVVSADLTVSDEDAYPTIDLSEGGCANTYYVTKPGELYRFRADVKGNGKALSLTGLSYTEADLQIEPKKALILWYDCVQTTYTPWKDACPIVKGSVQLSGDGYVYFSTPKGFINGNVVIIVLDTDLGYDEIQVDAKRQLSNANILWSWNLVCTEGYDPDVDPITVGDYTFMSRDRSGRHLDRRETERCGGHFAQRQPVPVRAQGPASPYSGLYESAGGLHDRPVLYGGLHADSGTWPLV